MSLSARLWRAGRSRQAAPGAELVGRHVRVHWPESRLLPEAGEAAPAGGGQAAAPAPPPQKDAQQGRPRPLVPAAGRAAAEPAAGEAPRGAAPGEAPPERAPAEQAPAATAAPAEGRGLAPPAGAPAKQSPEQAAVPAPADEAVDQQTAAERAASLQAAPDGAALRAAGAAGEPHQAVLTRRREAHWQRLQRLLKRQRVGQPQRQHLTSPKRRARRRRQSRQRSRAAACGTTALLPPSTQKRWGACLPHALAHSSGMCTLDVECMQLTGTGLSASLRLHAQHVDRLAELKTCMSCQATLSMMCVRGGAEHTPVAYVRQRLLAGSGWKAVTATRRIAWRAGQAHGAVRRRRGRAGRGPGGHALDAAARAPRAEQGCARWAHQSTTRAAP